jgi:hypothetical protein
MHAATLRKRKFRRQRRQAGMKAVEVWLRPDTAALIAHVKQPHESVSQLMDRALQALAQQAGVPGPQGQGPPHGARHAAAGETPQEADRSSEARAALVALLRMLLPEGQRRYLRDLGITAIPLVQLNTLLAPEGYVIEAFKVRDRKRFVDCVGQDGIPEPFGLFEMRRLAED